MQESAFPGQSEARQNELAMRHYPETNLPWLKNKGKSMPSETGNHLSMVLRCVHTWSLLSYNPTLKKKKRANTTGWGQGDKEKEEASACPFVRLERCPASGAYHLR